MCGSYKGNAANFFGDHEIEISMLGALKGDRVRANPNPNQVTGGQLPRVRMSAEGGAGTHTPWIGGRGHKSVRGKKPTKLPKRLPLVGEAHSKKPGPCHWVGPRSSQAVGEQRE